MVSLVLEFMLWKSRTTTCWLCHDASENLYNFMFIYMGLCVTTEKAMAPHSSTLAWKIPWMAEPGRLQSMRSLGVGRDWATSLSLFTFMHWRRKRQPTPVFLPWESQEWGSLVGCRLWGRTESDTTEVTYSTVSHHLQILSSKKK